LDRVEYKFSSLFFSWKHFCFIVIITIDYNSSDDCL
jgi:hypothetical protein